MVKALLCAACLLLKLVPSFIPSFLYFTIVEQHHAVEEELINAALMRQRERAWAFRYLWNYAEHGRGD